MSALYHKPSGHQQGDNQENKTPPDTYFITILCNNPALTSPGLMPKTARWLLVPTFHSCFTALPPTGRCGAKSVLPQWGPAQKASKSALLCPGVLLPCRSQRQPCKDWHREGSGKGPHHSGFTEEVRRKQLLLSLSQPAGNLPATAKQAGYPGSGDHPLVLSHTLIDWLRWDVTSGEGSSPLLRPGCWSHIRSSF